MRIGPDRPNTRWTITGVAVQTSTAVLRPAVNVYRGSINPGTFVSGTGTGSQDADNDLNEVLWPGEFVTVAWTGGDVGATATASFRGVIESGV